MTASNNTISQDVRLHLLKLRPRKFSMYDLAHIADEHKVGIRSIGSVLSNWYKRELIAQVGKRSLPRGGNPYIIWRVIEWGILEKEAKQPKNWVKQESSLEQRIKIMHSAANRLDLALNNW